MNNRFKFRAKRLDNNKFVYGYLCFIYIDNEKHCRIYSPDDTMSYDCYTETLGQCTGLKDKNGKLIYEGDICRVKGTYYDCDYHEYFEVDDIEITESLERFFEEAMVKGVYSALGCDTLQVEVIGNIHENADLLGEDK